MSTKTVSLDGGKYVITLDDEELSAWRDGALLWRHGRDSDEMLYLLVERVLALEEALAAELVKGMHP